MSAERRLPFMPTPQDGESPLSVIRRGATGNHHASTLRFAYAINPALDHSLAALGAVARSPEWLGSTFEAMGLSHADTTRVSYRRIGRARVDDVEWNGLRVGVGDLQYRRSKICVACYLEDGFASSQWDHVAAMACARHQVLLGDACPCCATAWTPLIDPLACGCDPRQMAARQQQCGHEVASVLDRIIRSADQSGLRVLSAMWSVLQWWRALGIRLSKAASATALCNLSASRWPVAPDAEAHVQAVVVHPRVALAPLLASSCRVTSDATRNLLQFQALKLASECLDNAWWPSTKAMAVLGTNRVPFKKLVQAGHLTRREDGRYSVAAINDLLWRVNGCREADVPMKPLSAHRAGPDPTSLASLITEISHGTITSYYCPIDTGLDGLRCVPVKRTAPTVEIFGLRDVARRLGTNTESVRCAIRLGWLEGVKGTSRSAVEWNISHASLQAFEDRYVFASAVAREHRVSSQTIASRLRSAGMVPVSGPDADGGITYVFDRKQMVQIDIGSVLKGSYRSPGGRKRGGGQVKQSGMLTSYEAAMVLGISVRQLREVMRVGWITSSKLVNRRKAYDAADVHELKRSLDQDFVSLAMAATKMGQSVPEFRRTWIYTGTISAQRFADRALISCEDLSRIRDIWLDSGTSTSIGRTLNRRRWLCPNLQKMEQIPPPTIVGTGATKVRLYARKTQALCKYNMT